MSRRFMVGLNPRNTVPLGGSRLAGRTWYTPEMIGLKEDSLKDISFVIWEGEEKKAKKVVKEEKKEIKAERLSKEAFYDLNRDAQEKELEKFSISHSYKDKELDLWKSYNKA